MKLTLWHDSTTPAATIEVDSKNPAACSLLYNEDWLDGLSGHALSPALAQPKRAEMTQAEHAECLVRFFANWLPEGQALDAAAQALKVSKASLFGLLLGLGKELPSAFSLTVEGSPIEPWEPALRAVTRQELSERIAARHDIPFGLWDGKVRLSIAGYQDKIGVYERAGRWFLVDGARHASTHILKPEPQSDLLRGLVSNEFFCMRLARAAGMDCALVELHHVPQPVLAIRRFDRRLRPDGSVERMAVIDGCQALDLSVGQKYERPFGNGRDVAHVREGASVPALFAAIGDHAAKQRAAARLQLLRWVILQVLLGNTDAHAKNISFFSSRHGLAQTPSYDLVCGLVFAGQAVEDSLAMAIGDTFDPLKVRAYDWAQMAYESGVPAGVVGRELQRLANAFLTALPTVREEVLAAGAQPDMADQVAQVVTGQCEQALKDASRVKNVDVGLFEEQGFGASRPKP